MFSAARLVCSNNAALSVANLPQMVPACLGVSDVDLALLQDACSHDAELARMVRCALQSQGSRHDLSSAGPPPADNEGPSDLQRRRDEALGASRQLAAQRLGEADLGARVRAGSNPTPQEQSPACAGGNPALLPAQAAALQAYAQRLRRLSLLLARYHAELAASTVTAIDPAELDGGAEAPAALLAAAEQGVRQVAGSCGGLAPAQLAEELAAAVPGGARCDPQALAAHLQGAASTSRPPASGARHTSQPPRRRRPPGRSQRRPAGMASRPGGSTSSGGRGAAPRPGRAWTPACASWLACTWSGRRMAAGWQGRRAACSARPTS